MPRHVWSVLCSKGIIDKLSNQVSMFDVLEKLTLKFTEGSAPPEAGTFQIDVGFHVVTMWVRENKGEGETARTRMALEAPDGRELSSLELEIDLATAWRSRAFYRIARFAYYGPGIYNARVDHFAGGDEWREVARVPLEIEVTSGTAPEDGPNA